jgi:pSer/pThr/pTyr-binding forkhead associated (FHA) protein
MIDLGSANGTYINDVAIQPQVPTPVMDNARLRFGNLVVTFMSAAPNRTVRL